MRRFLIAICLMSLLASAALVSAQEATPLPEINNLNNTIPACTPAQINSMVPAIIQINQLYRQTIAGSENLSAQNVANYFTSMLDLRNQFRYLIVPRFPDCTLALNHNTVFNALLDETLLSYALAQMAFSERALGNDDRASAYAQLARNAGTSVTQLTLLYEQLLISSFPTTEATPEPGS